MRCHRRGLFATINVGLVHGKGQRTPTWLDNKQYTSVVDRLLGNADINRLANFASCKPSFTLELLS
jgi:NAD dependent epimerase/dehydratase family enzyme